MKLTEWYSGDQKPMPDRIGVYERNYKYECGKKYYYCWWDGKNFGFGRPAVDECTSIPMNLSFSQNIPWRGVKK